MADLLSPEQMAKDLGVCVKTFSGDVRSKGIPFVLVGKRKRFDPAVVRAYLTTKDEPLKSNVIAMPVRKKGRKVVTSRKFAEAV
jgi:excisionase family DNA binding protein